MPIAKLHTHTQRRTHCTESLGVEHLPQVVRRQRVDGQDALVREAPLAAGDEDGQKLAVGRDVTACIVVDLAVGHQDVDGGWKRGWKQDQIQANQLIVSLQRLPFNF